MKFYVGVVIFLSFLLLVKSINPVVFLPGYSLCNLHVRVKDGNEQGCPSNGEFTVGYRMESVQDGFDLKCMYKYLDLSYDSSQPVGRRFVNHPKAKITIPGYTKGDVDANVNALYTDFIKALEANGLVKGKTLRSACYDFRMASNEDAIPGPTFMKNTKSIIEKAYSSAGKKRVYIVGHSNGGKGMLYFLSQQSSSWKHKYVAGVIGSAGNWPGQGLVLPIFKLGLNVVDFSFNSELANNQFYWTSNYFTMAQLSVFSGEKVATVWQTDLITINTTESSYDRFFRQTKNKYGLQHWRKYINLAGPETPPRVRTWVFRGAGISTVIGVVTPSFSNLTLSDYIVTTGDVNQEDTTNYSSDVWASTMPLGCYSAITYSGVDHFALTSNPDFISAVLEIISGDHSMDCS